MSAFRGKANNDVCGISLSRSLLGVKRTWVDAVLMSACDPKRTFLWRRGWPFLTTLWNCYGHPCPCLGGNNEAARVHQDCCWLRSFMAACGARAANRADASDRRADALPRKRSARTASCHGVPARTTKARLGRRSQCSGRFCLGPGRCGLDTIRRCAAAATSAGCDLANGTPAAKTMQQASSTSDPVLDGLVPSLARPGGNLTGFYVFEPSLPGKLLELLKEIAPHVTRVAMLTNPDTNPASWFASAVAVAPRFAVEVEAAPLRGSHEIEAAMAQWGRERNFGLIVVPDPATNAHRKLINELAARYRLPVIHALRAAAADGGLISYGIDLPNLFRQSAVYADRILRGANPADLPISQPTKFELVINLTSAKALGVEVPLALLVRADELLD
jgi:putative tryptophan/tyrosine transport system substrate-binding protein